ncbi:glycine cleavage system protein GcvH [Thermopetrobacter sp. TC1]|uniref:glycine cleavage system protein GcvH n=1 Tax=Thermopetrobacter sp. TC1 TaxID=1495045 RepID=UPI00056DF3B9|nr:glycine cleavage system protein GcvH [Thermopetrobacter sp. TC1]
MADIYYTKEHEWISVEGDIGTVGITKHAAEQLGDIVFVETPEVGTQVEQGGESGVVESVKAASDVYAPVSGEVVEVNPVVSEDPGRVNEDPEGQGWFYKVKLSNPDELKDLMDKAAYEAFVASEA